MIENLPIYISAIFILTTFLTIGFFLLAFKGGIFSSSLAKILHFIILFWLLFQGFLAISGFYLNTDSIPARLLIFAVFPAGFLIILLFVFFRTSISELLSLKTLTLLHVVRIPVELVLWWLFQNRLVPQLMTFEGRNFDILAGITAPLIAWLAFRNGKTNRSLLIIWNICALLLLINIVVNAVLSFPAPFQQFAFEQPNRAVQYFPFVWLPSIVVPIVLFSHLASLWQLTKNDSKL